MQDSPKDRSQDLSALQRRAFGSFKTVPRTCPSCGDDNEGTRASRYSLGQWTVKTCRTCSFTYITTAPDYDSLRDQLVWEATSKLEDSWRHNTRRVQQSISKKTRWRLHLLRRRTMPTLLDRYADTGNVVDLGCGDGGQLEGLPDRFVPYGVEISQCAAEEANARFRARGGMAVNAPCLEGLSTFPEGHFTAATLRSYLEHEMRPAEVLRALNRVLRADGVAIVKVPKYGSLNRRVMGKRWCGFRHPDHLNYFTPATLARMARRSGFKPWFGLTWRLPTGDNMWALLKKQFVVGALAISEGFGALFYRLETAILLI